MTIFKKKFKSKTPVVSRFSQDDTAEDTANYKNVLYNNIPRLTQEEIENILESVWQELNSKYRT